MAGRFGWLLPYTGVKKKVGGYNKLVWIQFNRFYKEFHFQAGFSS